LDNDVFKAKAWRVQWTSNTKGILIIENGSLRFEPARGKRPPDVIEINQIKDVRTEYWPHPILAFALWVVIRWPALVWGRLANLNLYLNNHGLHLRVSDDDRERILRLLKAK
jgi:hypothetical protein